MSAGINLYAYVNNNPLIFIDPNGLESRYNGQAYIPSVDEQIAKMTEGLPPGSYLVSDVAFSVDPNGAGGNGHTTFHFQEKNGQWHAYDQGASGETSSGNGGMAFIAGLDAPAGVTIISTNGPPAGSYYIKTTPSQDEKITKSAVDSARLHNSGQINYNLYRNNCTDAGVDVLNNSGTGITVDNPATTVRPNSWIKELNNAVELQIAP